MKGSDTDTELAVVHSLCCTVWIDKSHSASVCSSLFFVLDEIRKERSGDVREMSN